MHCTNGICAQCSAGVKHVRHFPDFAFRIDRRYTYIAQIHSVEHFDGKLHRFGHRLSVALLGTAECSEHNVPFSPEPIDKIGVIEVGRHAVKKALHLGSYSLPIDGR